MEKIKNTRILGAIGLLFLFLGVVLPYFKITFFGYDYEIKLWGFWEGKVMMTLIIANLLFIFKDYVEKYIPKLFESEMGSKIKNASPKMSIIPTIGLVAFAIWLYLDLDIDTKYLEHGLGFWSLWIGIVLLIIYTIICKKNHLDNSVHYMQVDQIQSEMSSKKQCPECGNFYDMNASSCPMCRRNF